jgi:hypothetical protein
MILNRSSLRIVMVIVPVAFIAGAPKGADDQPTGQNTTFLFSGNATSELGTYIVSGDNDYYVKSYSPETTVSPTASFPFSQARSRRRSTHAA